MEKDKEIEGESFFPIQVPIWCLLLLLRRYVLIIIIVATLGIAGSVPRVDY